jgi:hypothetical protein
MKNFIINHINIIIFIISILIASIISGIYCYNKYKIYDKSIIATYEDTVVDGDYATYIYKYKINNNIYDYKITDNLVDDNGYKQEPNNEPEQTITIKVQSDNPTKAIVVSDIIFKGIFIIYILTVVILYPILLILMDNII